MTKQIQVRSTEEALKLALEALEEPHPGIRTSFTDAVTYREKVKQAITALREALAEQPAPGRAHYEDGDVFERIAARKHQPAQTDWEAVAADQAMTIALLRAEQTAQRKPLTGEEMNQIEARWDASMHGSKIAFVVRETEAAHGIKENT